MSDQPDYLNILSGSFTYSFGSLFFDGADYDPLRSRESIATAPLPTLVKGSYMPFVSRSVSESGVWFNQENFTNFKGDKVPGTQAYASVRVANVLHNPYNVTVSYDQMTFHARGSGMTYNFYNGPEPSTTLVQGIPEEGDKDSDNDGEPDEIFLGELPVSNNARSIMPAGDMAPGSFKVFDTNHVRTATLSNEIVDGTYVDWIGAEKVTDTQKGNKVGAHFDNSITSLTITARSETAKQTNINTNLLSSATAERFTRATPTYYLTMQEDGAAVQNNQLFGQRVDWPVAYSSSMTILGPGPKYHAAAPGDAITDLYRFPVGDLNFYDPDEDPDEYLYSFRVDAIDPTTNSTLQASLPLIQYDYQLRPSEFVSQNGEPLRYPVFTMTNPLAPVKDNRALFPSDQLASVGSLGFPTYSPSWELQVKQSGQVAGLYSNWGPSDGSPDTGLTNVVSLELP
ncbi:MAG: hypothetical protein AAF226_16265, partial [Verrucomicrobiota bacterium]